MKGKIDVEKYKRDGFVVVKNFLQNDEINSFQRSVQELIHSFMKNNSVKPCNSLLHEGFIKLDQLDHQHIHNIYNIVKDSDTVGSIVNSEKMISYVKQLLNLKEASGVLYNMYHVVRLDPPNDGRFLYKWHQESYYSVPGCDSVQVWAPLVEKSTVENGTIQVLVGSHKREIQHMIEKVEQGHEQKYILDSDIHEEYDTLTVEIDVGDVLFFHPLLIHKSGNNTSSRVRYSLTSHYLNPISPNFNVDFLHDLSQYHAERCKNYNEYKDRRITCE